MRPEVGEELEGVGPPVGDIDSAGAFGIGADLFDGPSPEGALAGTPLALLCGGFSIRDGVADVEDLADEAENGAVGGIDREGVVREPAAPAAVADGSVFGLEGGAAGVVRDGGVVDEQDGSGDGGESLQDGIAVGGEDARVGGLGCVEEVQAGAVLARIGEDPGQRLAGAVEDVADDGLKSPVAPDVAEVQVGEQFLRNRRHSNSMRHNGTSKIAARWPNPYNSIIRIIEKR